MNARQKAQEIVEKNRNVNPAVWPNIWVEAVAEALQEAAKVEWHKENSLDPKLWVCINNDSNMPLSVERCTFQPNIIPFKNSNWKRVYLEPVFPTAYKDWPEEIHAIIAVSRMVNDVRLNHQLKRVDALRDRLKNVGE